MAEKYLNPPPATPEGRAPGGNKLDYVFTGESRVPSPTIATEEGDS